MNKPPILGGSSMIVSLTLISRAQDVGILVHVHLLQLFTCWSEVLARVELAWLLREHLADDTGHSQSSITVDVDLANSTGSCPAKLLLWNANGVFELATILLDHLNVLLGYRGGSVQNDGEVRKLLFNLFEDVKA